MVCSLLPVSAFAAEPDYELRVLTFEDADYKGGTNFAGGNNWTSLIDSPQYGGKMLYGESGAGVDSVDAAYKWTDKNNTWLSNTLSEGYGSWCYWSGGHAVSNYVSGEISKYGGFESQLTVYKKDVSGLERTGGGHFLDFLDLPILDICRNHIGCQCQIPNNIQRCTIQCLLGDGGSHAVLLLLQLPPILHGAAISSCDLIRGKALFQGRGVL